MNKSSNQRTRRIARSRAKVIKDKEKDILAKTTPGLEAQKKLEGKFRFGCITITILIIAFIIYANNSKPPRKSTPDWQNQYSDDEKKHRSKDASENLRYIKNNYGD